MAKIIGGPFKDFKFGGFTFTPVKDSGSELETSGVDFEANSSSNGEIYAIGNARAGYVQQECVMTLKEYKTFKAMQDGETRSGTATMLDNSVVSMNGLIDGEHALSDGKITVKISGKVDVQ